VGNILGIIGGMGVVASAEFTRTVYEYNTREVEQDSAAVILLSDPVFPDRTQSYLSGSSGELLAVLENKLGQLRAMNASKIILACVTLHYVIPLLPVEFRRNIISLVDVALTDVIKSARKQLLFCSNGARGAGVFQSHEKWDRAKDYIVWPDEQDQTLVHALLYQYKVRSDKQPFLPHLHKLLHKYQVDSFVAGCSELHLLTKYLARQHSSLQFIDPLDTIARNLDSFMSQTAQDCPPASGPLLPESRRRPLEPGRLIKIALVSESQVEIV
jgi:aspartate racemase